jgi:hypothetical protein
MHVPRRNLSIQAIRGASELCSWNTQDGGEQARTCVLLPSVVFCGKHDRPDEAELASLLRGVGGEGAHLILRPPTR